MMRLTPGVQLEELDRMINVVVHIRAHPQTDDLAAIRNVCFVSTK